MQLFGFYKRYILGRTDPEIIYVSSFQKIFLYVPTFRHFIDTKFPYSKLLKQSESDSLDSIPKDSRNFYFYKELIKELDPDGYRRLTLVIQNPKIRGNPNCKKKAQETCYWKYSKKMCYCKTKTKGRRNPLGSRRNPLGNQRNPPGNRNEIPLNRSEHLRSVIFWGICDIYETFFKYDELSDTDLYLELTKITNKFKEFNMNVNVSLSEIIERIISSNANMFDVAQLGRLYGKKKAIDKLLYSSNPEIINSLMLSRKFVEEFNINGTIPSIKDLNRL